MSPTRCVHARAFCRRAWLQSAHDLVCIIRALSSPKDPHDPRNFRKTIEKIMSADYAVPMALNLSPECLNLLRRMLDTNPFNRITIPQVRARVSSPELSISARSDDDKLPHFFFGRMNTRMRSFPRLTHPLSPLARTSIARVSFSLTLDSRTRFLSQEPARRT